MKSYHSSPSKSGSRSGTFRASNSMSSSSISSSYSSALMNPLNGWLRLEAFRFSKGLRSFISSLHRFVGSDDGRARAGGVSSLVRAIRGAA